MEWTLKRRIWLLLGGAVVLTIFFIWLSGRRPVARVVVVPATRQNLSASISTNGKVEPITPYAIRAQLTTFVEKIVATEGQIVRRGQLLMTLDVEQTRADLARAREQLIADEDDLRAARAGGRTEEIARINSDLRKAELDRNRLERERQALERLLSKQAATQDELDQNQLQLERVEADLQRLRKAKEELARRTPLDVERARLRVERSREQIRDLDAKVRSAQVVAPADGILYSLPVHASDFVKVGDPLAELADLHRVRVRAFVDEPELGSLEPNQRVDISWDALSNRIWYGRTEQVPRQVVARGTRSVGEVLCSVDNEKLELLPNINVNVRIHLRERSNVLAVPRDAVHTEGSRRFVYVVNGGHLGVERKRLQKREIHVGIASATNYEVFDGLQEGEMVALPTDVELRDGLRVRVVSQ